MVAAVSLRGHEPCRLFVSSYAAVVFPDTGKYADLDPRAASSACCAAAADKEACKPWSNRPFALGDAFTSLEAVAFSAGDRQTGNSSWVAPKRISFVLALEEQVREVR